MRRLSRAGFKSDFVRLAILPDWWEETCAEDPTLLPDVEIRVARFLGLPLATVKDQGAILCPRVYSGAQLRKVRDIDRDRLGPAIHSAMQVAAAVVRTLKDAVGPAAPPPTDGLSWRAQIQHTGPAVDLRDILSDLWQRGIPVVPLDVLPAPGFQGMACIVEQRPVILLGYRHDEPGRVGFLIGHETGHVAAGDCLPDQPVVDENETILDAAEIETKADRYASLVLLGSESAPQIEGSDFRELAERAVEQERQTGADAGAIISAWAARTRDYAKATMAWKALYRSSGARRQLGEYFARHVDFQSAAESDRNLLRCILGDPERDETVD